MHKRFSQQELQTLVSLWGANLDDWPDELVGQLTDDDSVMQELRLLLENEQRFEQTLLGRSFEAHDSQLPHDIINSALNEQKASPSVDNDVKLTRYWQYLFAKPVYSMAATLLIGVVLGYYVPGSDSGNVDDGFDDYSALLYDQDELL